jgi:hypothetical protein
VWRRLSGPVRIAVAATAGTAEIEAALSLAVALHARGAQPEVTTDAAGAAILVGAQPEALSVSDAGQGPVLRVADAAAARALVALPGILRAPGAVAAARTTGAAPPAAAPTELAFGDLAILPAPVAFSGGGRIGFELPFDRLPAGRVPTALRMFLGGSALPGNETVLVSLMAGQRLIGSTAMRGQIGLEGWEVALPEDLVRHRMRFELVLQRISQSRGCASEGVPMDRRPPPCRRWPSRRACCRMPAPGRPRFRSRARQPRWTGRS